jgi:hypothetical protein
MAAGFPLMVNDIAIRTSEALYQASRFPHRPDVQHEIIAQASPLVVKMKSRWLADYWCYCVTPSSTMVRTPVAPPLSVENFLLFGHPIRTVRH